jgi:uncharacterized protein YjeT (DUF2065 family)
MSDRLRTLTVGIVANAKPLQKGLSSATSTLRSFAGTAIGVLGGLSLLQQALEEDKISTAAVANLNSVLNSTGHAAGFTSEQLQKMAGDLQQVTTFGDDATIQAQAVLATFTQINGDIFAEAIATAQDLSTVLGQDLQSSIVQMGKALNDPIKGITALSKVGVSFSQEQKTLIKSLVETGDVAGAQRVILAELAKEFGGAATAQAKTLGGQIQQLKNSFGDLLETGIAMVTPPLLSLVGHMKSLVGAISEIRLPTFTGNVVRLAAAFTTAAIILPKIISLLRGISTVLGIVAARQAIVQALSGPKGWLQLAGGIAVATGTLVALNAMMVDSSSAATTQAVAIGQSTAAMREKAEVNAEQVKAEEALIASLREQIATFGMSSEAVEIYKAKMNGASAEVIADAKKLQAILAGKQQSAESLKAYDDLIQKGKELTDSLKSPLEQQQALFDQYRDMALQGIITRETYALAVAKANKETNQPRDMQAPKSPQALEQGSAGAYQAIAEARGTQKMMELQEKQLQAELAQLAALRQLVQSSGTDQQQPVTVNF